MTAQEFEASRPQFWRLTEDTIEMARLVLVEGHSQSDVARKYELTRQRVSLAVKQVLTAVEEIPNGWVKLEIWLPPAMASKVRDMAQRPGNQVLAVADRRDAPVNNKTAKIMLHERQVLAGMQRVQASWTCAVSSCRNGLRPESMASPGRARTGLS